MLTAGFSGDDYTLDLEARLVVGLGTESGEEFELSFNDQDIDLTPAYSDGDVSRSRPYGSPLRIRLTGTPSALVIRIRVDPRTVDQKRLSGMDVADSAYWNHTILKMAVNVLADATLVAENCKTGEVLTYGFDIERFENQWDYESQLRKGGPAVISLERLES